MDKYYSDTQPECTTLIHSIYEIVLKYTKHAKNQKYTRSNKYIELYAHIRDYSGKCIGQRMFEYKIENRDEVVNNFIL